MGSGTLARLALGILASTLREAHAAGPSVKAQQLQLDLQTAADSQALSFDVLPGDYDFGDTPLSLKGARGLTIEARNATAWFAIGGGVELVDCSDVGLHGLTVDYSPTLAQGSVVDCCEGDTFTADFDSAFLLPNSTYEEWFNSFFDAASGTTGEVKVAFWDPLSRTMVRDDAKAGAINIMAHGFIPLPGGAKGAERYRVSISGLKPSGVSLPLPAGALVTVFPRGGHHSIELRNSSGLSLSDVSVYGGSSMGLVEVGGGGGNHYERLVIGRRPLPGAGARLLAVNADAFHSSDNGEGPTIVDSDIGFAGDDLGNTHISFFILLQVLNTSTVIVIDHDGSPGPSGNLAHTLRAASSLSFYRLNSLDAISDSPSRVLSVIPADDADTMAALAVARATMLQPPYNAKFQNASWTNARALVVTLDRIPAEAEALKTTVTNDHALNAGTRLFNSSLHDGYSRAWMVKSRDSHIAGNVFSRAGGLHVVAKQTWLEGDPGITDVTIENNVLEACGTHGIQVDPDVHGTSIVRNNTETVSRALVV